VGKPTRVGQVKCKEKEAKKRLSKNKQARTWSSRTRGNEDGCGSTKKRRNQSAKSPKHVQRRERGKQEREAETQASACRARKAQSWNKKSTESKSNGSEKSENGSWNINASVASEPENNVSKERLRRLQWHAEVKCEREQTLGTQARTDGEASFCCCSPLIGLVHDIG